MLWNYTASQGRLRNDAGTREDNTAARSRARRPSRNAAVSPNVFQIRPNTTLESSAPTRHGVVDAEGGALLRRRREVGNERALGALHAPVIDAVDQEPGDQRGQ